MERSEITANLPRATLTGFSVQCPEEGDFAIKYLSLPASEI